MVSLVCVDPLVFTQPSFAYDDYVAYALSVGPVLLGPQASSVDNTCILLLV